MFYAINNLPDNPKWVVWKDYTAANDSINPEPNKPKLKVVK